MYFTEFWILNFKIRDVHHGNHNPTIQKLKYSEHFLNQGTARNGHSMMTPQSSICPYTGMNVEPFIRLALSGPWSRVVRVRE
jgi:hypothetical protein